MGDFLPSFQCDAPLETEVGQGCNVAKEGWVMEEGSVVSVVSARWGGGGAFAGVCHGVAETVGGDQGIDWFGRV